MIAPRRSILVVGLATLALLAGVAAALAATTQQTTRANRAVASLSAARLLDELVLPAGSHRVARAPRGSSWLNESETVELEAAQIDRTRFWTTTASPQAVISDITRHLPPHDSAGSGTAQAPGSSLTWVAANVRVDDRRALSLEQITVNAATLARGGTGVRADAQIVYRAPRPADERVPAAARVLDVVRTATGEGRRIDDIVRNVAVIAHLGQLIDGLAFERRPYAVAPCPFLGNPGIVSLTFRARPGGAVLAQLTTPADPSMGDLCSITTLEVAGRPLPHLLGGGPFLREADRLLGLRLAEHFTLPRR